MVRGQKSISVKNQRRPGSDSQKRVRTYLTRQCRNIVSGKPGTGAPNGEDEAPTRHERGPRRDGWYGEGEMADGISPVAE
jgi:hypothetical protein